jgi:hypothetical protein
VQTYAASERPIVTINKYLDVTSVACYAFHVKRTDVLEAKAASGKRAFARQRYTGESYQAIVVVAHSDEIARCKQNQSATIRYESWEHAARRG